MTGTSRWPRLIIACRAGKIFLCARSPVAPKNTSASECDVSMLVSPRLIQRCTGLLAGLLQMPAEAEAHRRQELVLEVRLAPRAEAFVQRGGEYRGRHRFVDRCLDGPAAFARIQHASGELRQRRVGEQGACG